MTPCQVLTKAWQGVILCAMGRKRREWQPESACLPEKIKANGHTADIFFPGKGRPKKNPIWKSYCASCPVLNDCFQFAIVHNEDGVWGGTTREQRSRLSKEIVDHLTKQAEQEGWLEFLPEREEEVLVPAEPDILSFFEILEDQPFVLERPAESPMVAQPVQMETPIFPWDAYDSSTESQFSLTP